ncbi:MAG TPA: T9SS type A sorting domain-containing protein [Ohtaekwangia sp.]|nr:T9SS type A sorting domain-containing protein [Ohtaekwangia sp.]
MRILYSICFLFLVSAGYGQSIFISTETGGPWQNGSSWNCLDGACLDDPGLEVPGAGDIAVIAVTTGFISVTNNSNYEVADLYIMNDVPANSLRPNSVFGVGVPTITITGSLSGISRAMDEFLPPTGQVINQSAKSPRFVFSGTTASEPLITNWGTDAQLRYVTFSPGVATTKSIHTFSVGSLGTVDITDGIINIASGHYISDPNGNATITVQPAAALRISGSISRDGSASGQFNSIVINGSCSVQDSGFLNANNITLGAESTLSILAGTTNTGWYRTTPPTGVLNFASGTVAYAANGNQIVVPVSYGDLALSGSGAKSLSGGTVTLGGDISIASGVSFNTNASLIVMGNVENEGTWSAAQIISFEGEGPQILGGNPIGFAAGLNVGNATTTPATLLRLTYNLDINGELRIYADASLDLDGNTLFLGGNLTSNGVFATTNTNSLVVFDGTTIINSTTATLPNITITGSLTAPTTLNVAGNFTNNGTFNANSGTVIFNGTINQAIGGTSVTTFRNMTISNGTPDIVSIESAQNLAGILTLSPNSLFDADGLGGGNNVFTLLSNDDEPTQDASIAAIPSTAGISGRITVQRFMEIEGVYGGRVYRYIASPVVGATVADLQTEIPVTGPFSGADNMSPNHSMFYYNEAVTSDVNGSGGNDVNDGMVGYPTTSNTQTFVNGRGYTLFVRGDLLTGSARWDLRGEVRVANNTPVNLNPTFTPSGNASNDGWNLIGNPFPSAIDWDSPSWQKANIDGTIYITDNTQANGETIYRLYNGSIQTNGANRYIATGQAFYVKASGPNPVLTLTENVKSPGTTTSFFREAELTNILRTALVNGSRRDEMVVHFREDATENFDNHADAWKLPNSSVNLYSISAGNKLAINSLGTLSCNHEIQLGISQVKPDTYTLQFSQFESFDNRVQIKLTDHYTNAVIDVRNGSYTFAVSSDPATFGDKRFTLSWETSLSHNVDVLTPAPTCEQPSPEIQIQDSQQGVMHYLVMNDTGVSDTLAGTGNTIKLILHPDAVSAGINNLKLIRSLGCGIESETSIPLIIQPQYTISSVSSTSACQSGSVTLEASASYDDAIFKWYESIDSEQAIPGETGSTYVIALLSKTKTYYVAAVNPAGCEGPRTKVEAAVVQYDPAEITANGYQLVSNYETGNQWYFNGEPIEGAIAETFNAKHSGLYELQVNINGCITTATHTADVKFTLEDLIPYPNPVSDVVYFDIAGIEGSLYVKLITPVGREIGSDKRLEFEGKDRFKVNMGDLDPGIYLIKIQSKNKIHTFKVIKN